MFQVFEIAKAKHAELNTHYSVKQAVEGMTVEVPNALDRAWLAAQKALRRAAHVLLARTPTLPAHGATARMDGAAI